MFFQSYKKIHCFLGDAEEVEGDESPEPEGEGGEQEEEEQVSNYILLSYIHLIYCLKMSSLFF